MKHWVGVVAISWLFAQATIAWNVDFNALVDDFNNITATFTRLEGDVNATSQALIGLMSFLETNWPQIEKHLARIAELPDSIKYAAQVVNTAVPTITTCAYVLGGCAVVGVLIATIPKILKYCRHNRRPVELYN